MFVHTNRTTSTTGKVHEYVRILETYYEDGKHKQKIVANLGRLDRIRDNLPVLAKKLAELAGKHLAAPNEVQSNDAVSWGGVLLARHLFDELKLGETIRRHCDSSRRKIDVAETAFVLLANRLTEPTSEHGLASWLEHTYVCDRNGKRWLPDWKPVPEITKTHRVRVQHRQLNLWYRTLDALLRGRKGIEKDLYYRVRDLFHTEVDMVLYDMTNTYFSRRSPTEKLRRHTVSKDGKPRNVHVALGIVMANGWPIAHHVFAGNTSEKTTLPLVIEDLENRFGLRRVLVVADRGLVSDENLEFLSTAGREVTYLLGIPGRRSDEAASVFRQVQENPDTWQQVDQSNRVQEVQLTSPKQNANVRHFVVESNERKEYEAELRQRSMARAAEGLDKIRQAIEAGRLKNPTKIAARAARTMTKNHASRYYSYEVDDNGNYRYWEDEGKLAAETLHEGRYILKTDDPSIAAADSVDIYKQLSDVEWAYRDLKDVIDLRPIHHRSDPRIEAHIFVATLALFMKRTLEHHLDEKGIVLSPTQAIEAMKSMGVSELDFDGESLLLTSKGGRDARRLTQALGIRKTDPPRRKLRIS